MTKQKSLFIPLTLLGAALSIELVIVPGFSTKVLAQSELANSSQSIPSSLFAGVTFEPPRDGKPDDTAGGASRDPNYKYGYITPLMPSSNKGLTVSDRPTFLFYIPETSAKAIFFSLTDENNNYDYQTKTPITVKSGIVSFQLPNNAPSLEIGKNYKWSFVLIGEEPLQPSSPGVQGKIRRVEPNPVMLSQLQNKTLLERAALYGKNGIWIETVLSLAEARKSQPSDANLATTWQELLKSAGLQAIATKPILN